MAWNVITLSDGSTRWADEQTAKEYLDQVFSLTDDQSEAFTRLVQQGTNAEQHQAVSKTWGMLGTAYKCLNVVPQTDVAYLTHFARAYGFEENRFANIDLFFQQRNIEHLSIVSNTTSETGWMVRSAANLVFRDAASRTYARNNNIDYVLRIWLTKECHIRVSCFESPYARTCVDAASQTWYDVAGKTQLFGVNIHNKDCKDAYDWQCVQRFGNKVVFPALIWSMNLAHSIAASILTNGLRETIESSIRRAGTLSRPALVYNGQPDVYIQPPSSQGAVIGAPTGPDPTVTSPDQPTGPTPTVTPVGQTPTMPGPTPTVTPIGQTLSDLGSNPMQVPIATPVTTTPTSTPTSTPTPTPTSTPIAKPVFTLPNMTPPSRPPTQRNPMATNNAQTLTLDDLNITCDRWLAMDENQKRLAVQSAFLEKYNISISADAVSVVAAAISATCPTSTSRPNTGTPSTQGPAPGPTRPNSHEPLRGRPLPATLGDIFVELNTDCVTWLRNATTAKVELIRQAIFIPRGLQPSTQDIQKLVATLDACASSAVRPPVQSSMASWWDGSGPLLVGGALVGGLIWYAFREKKLEENVFESGGLLGPLEPSPSVAPTQTETVTDTFVESTTFRDSESAPTLSEEILGG